jgi:outer membrane protein OmpA-like peptidoglycan-associated protein
MSNAFMILSLFLLLVLFKSLFLKYTSDQTQVSLNQTENQVEELERQVQGLQRLLQGRDRRVSVLKNQLAAKDALAEKLKTQVGELLAQVSSLTSEVDQLKSAPPVVVIENSGEYQFTSGSADLPPTLKDYIKNELVDRIEQVTNARGIYVVEIIGHTDGQVNFNGVSNLDENLEDVALGIQSINQLKPGSNADLGLMRALEVVKQLQEIQQQEERLRGLEFRAYSAAQLLLPSGEFATTQRQPDAQRRRIEIRFSPLGKAETVR